jgi:hypothetical protein
MDDIAKSASKLVFLILTATACGAFLFGRLDMPSFMILAVSAYSYYFAKKDGVK